MSDTPTVQYPCGTLVARVGDLFDQSLYFAHDPWSQPDNFLPGKGIPAWANGISTEEPGPNGKTIINLKGIPQAGDVGTYSITTEGFEDTVTAGYSDEFLLVVFPSIAIGLASAPPAATVGQFYSYQIVLADTNAASIPSGAAPFGLNTAITSSFVPQSWQTSNNIPPGLSLSPSGLVSGVPTQYNGTGASFFFRATIKDPVGNAATGDFSQPIVINQAFPNVTSGNASPEETQPFLYQITGDNGPITGYTVDPPGLPPGLVFDIAGTIHGTGGGNVIPAGSWASLLADSAIVPIRVGNSRGFGPQKTVTFTLIYHEPPVINSPLTAHPEITLNFSYQITAFRHPTSFNAVGLPAGLSVNVSTGVISGVPSTMGTFNVSISASNAYGADTKTLVLNIGFPPPTINSPVSAFGIVGVPFAYQITVDPAGQPATGYNASGLPPGLSVSTSTGLVSGTPTQVGSFPSSVYASNVGLYGAIPADPPSRRAVTITIFASPPTATAISPNVVNSTAGVQFTVTGTGFLGAVGDPKFANFAVILNNQDQGEFVFQGTAGTPSAFATSGTTVLFTPTGVPPSPIPYDVVVRNEDMQIGTLRRGLIVLPPGISVVDAARLTSLDSIETPIYTSSAANETLVPRGRIFALGTNVEVLFYSGRDVIGNTIQNVYRKQMGTTSTRHGPGDLVFKGMLSLQASPGHYVVSGGPIGAVYCLIRSNGRVDMRILQSNGLSQTDDAMVAYASYQATLVRFMSPVPLFELKERG